MEIRDVPPSGTVTFLFTDIEGSTKLWEAHPDAMRQSLLRHDTLVREGIVAHRGHVFKTVGDGVCAAFGAAPEAAAAALTLQTALHAEPWPAEAAITVRMALHTGAADERDGDYFGPPLNRVARLLAVGHGGQILISQTTRDLCHDVLPADARLVPLGEHRLNDLAHAESIYQLVSPGLPDTFPPLRSLDPRKHNLPLQVTSFVGRQEVLARVRASLNRSRILTLTGVGGCGKTRLALEVAADLGKSFADGVWLVELGEIGEADLVASRVAAVLGVREAAGRSAQDAVREALRDREMLLLLDNAEHLLAACAHLADSLVRHCPGVRLLVTSRERLAVSGEQVIQVPALELPDLSVPPTAARLAPCETVRLFVERAALVRDDFRLTDANAPAVASVCHRLDGIPLAIELAAARVRAMSVEEIERRLDQRFRLLTGGSRSSLPRQQTLRALIDWSYNLLTESEQALLRRLAVFAGGWTLEAAEEVCSGEPVDEGEVLDLLTGLADKSLLQVDPWEGGVRYRFLDTVRHYAADRLREQGDAAFWRRRHRDAMVTLVEEAEPHLLTGGDQERWLARLEVEHDNLRAALDTSAADPEDGEAALSLCGVAFRFWMVRGVLREGLARCRTALAHPGAQRRNIPRAQALQGAGIMAALLGDAAAATACFRDALAISREWNALELAVSNLNNLAVQSARDGDFAGAATDWDEALSLCRQTGDRAREALCLGNLGWLARLQNDRPRARTLQTEARRLNQELGNPVQESANVLELGLLFLEEEALEEAEALLWEALEMARRLGERSNLVDGYEALGRLEARRGHLDLAVEMWGTASAWREAHGMPREPADAVWFAAAVADAQASLGAAAADEAWRRGAAGSLDGAVDRALEGRRPSGVR